MSSARIARHVNAPAQTSIARTSMLARSRGGRAPGRTFGVRHPVPCAPHVAPADEHAGLRCAHFRPSRASHLALPFGSRTPIGAISPHDTGPAYVFAHHTSWPQPPVLHTSSLSGIRNRWHSSPISKQPQAPGMSAGKFRRHRELRDGPRGQSDGNVWAIKRQWKTVSRGGEGSH
jgi:hypothetical protein